MSISVRTAIITANIRTIINRLSELAVQMGVHLLLGGMTPETIGLNACEGAELKSFVTEGI